MKVQAEIFNDLYLGFRRTPNWENDPSQLFNDITSLVVFGLSECIWRCCHCAIDYDFFENGEGATVMDEDVALSLVEMVPKLQQTTAAGTEFPLLDESIRTNAISNKLIPKKINKKLHGIDYAEQLLGDMVDHVWRDWGIIGQMLPKIRATKHERFVRVPTNGWVFPWLWHEGIDIFDSYSDDDLRQSLLYQTLEKYIGVTFVVSIGPFNHVEYIKRNVGNKEQLTMERRITEFNEVAALIKEDYQDIQGKPEGAVTLGLGYIFTHAQPSGVKIDDIDWDQVDKEMGEFWGIENPPSNLLDRNEVVQFIRSWGYDYELEKQEVYFEGEAKQFPWAYKGHRTTKLGPHESYLVELYAVPVADGKTVWFFDNTVDMYGPCKENAHFALRFN